MPYATIQFGNDQIQRVWEGSTLLWEKPSGNALLVTVEPIESGASPGDPYYGQVALPLQGGMFTVNWGDGSPPEEFTVAEQDGAAHFPLHDYGVPGPFQISVTGNASLFGATENVELTQPSELSNRWLRCVVGVDQWGDLGITSLRGLLRFTSDSYNSVYLPSDIPSSCVDLSWMFRSADLALSNLSSLAFWDVSNVQNMEFMFDDASLDVDLSNWTTSSLTSLRGTFRGALFNPDVGSWDVAQVVTFQSAFENSAFNRDISAWQPVNPTTFWNAFLGSPLSRANYDALLLAWSQLSFNYATSSVRLDTDATYTEAAARSALIDRGWIISDGGLYSPPLVGDQIVDVGTMTDIPGIEVAADSTLELTNVSAGDRLRIGLWGAGGNGSNGQVGSPGHGGGGGAHLFGVVYVYEGDLYGVSIVDGTLTLTVQNSGGAQVGRYVANAGGDADASGPGAGGIMSVVTDMPALESERIRDGAAGGTGGGGTGGGGGGGAGISNDQLAQPGSDGTAGGAGGAGAGGGVAATEFWYGGNGGDGGTSGSPNGGSGAVPNGGGGGAADDVATPGAGATQAMLRLSKIL